LFAFVKLDLVFQY